MLRLYWWTKLRSRYLPKAAIAKPDDIGDEVIGGSATDSSLLGYNSGYERFIGGRCWELACVTDLPLPNSFFLFVPCDEDEVAQIDDHAEGLAEYKDRVLAIDRVA